MGEVAVVYKINPDLDKKEEIKKELSNLGAKEIKEENVGFGILIVRRAILNKPCCERRAGGQSSFDKLATRYRLFDHNKCPL